MKLQIGIYKTNEIVNGRFACQLLAIFSLIVLILAHPYSHALAYGSCDTITPHTPLKKNTFENVPQFQISALIQTYLSGVDSCEKVGDGCQIAAPEMQRKNFRFKQEDLLKTKIRPIFKNLLPSFFIQIAKITHVFQCKRNIFIEEIVRTIVMTI